jgi:hypothetical protein
MFCNLAWPSFVPSAEILIRIHPKSFRVSLCDLDCSTKTIKWALNRLQNIDRLSASWFAGACNVTQCRSKLFSAFEASNRDVFTDAECMYSHAKRNESASRTLCV